MRQSESAKTGTDSLPIDAPQRRRVPLLLRHAWFSLNQAFRRRIVHLSITPDQFTVLRTLLEDEGASLTQRKIAELMSSDPNTVAALLERMERNGLIQRRPHLKDKRARQILLLELGRQTYDQARKIAVKLQQDVLKALPKKDHAHFLEQLAIVAEACREAASESLGSNPDSTLKADQSG